MLRSKYDVYAFISVLSFLPVIVYADNAWGNYRSVERPKRPAYQAPAQDPFALPQRYTPTAPPKGYYYQPYQNNNHYPNHRPGVRVEYYPETQYEGSYRRESFVVGNELPSEFRSERYVIEDWNGQYLREPPRGRHWVMVDGRYLLVTDDNFMIEIIR